MKRPKASNVCRYLLLAVLAAFMLLLLPLACEKKNHKLNPSHQGREKPKGTIEGNAQVVSTEEGERKGGVADTENSAMPKSDSVKRRIHDLVDRLASPEPPKYEDGTWFSNIEPTMKFSAGYEHSQVTEAERDLLEMGSKAFPELIEHLNDSRYSYSRVQSAWINHSVGDKVKEIIARQIGFKASPYIFRKNPKGRNDKPSVRQYLKEIDLKKWAERAVGLSEDELRYEFITWYIEKEKAYGFNDEKQKKKILQPYEEERVSLSKALEKL